MLQAETTLDLSLLRARNLYRVTIVDTGWRSQEEVERGRLQQLSYVPETNRVSRAHSVANVQNLQSVLHVMLFPMLNMFCTFTATLPAVCGAQYGCFL